MSKLILNSTQIPNIILDEWQPVLTPAEFLVVMVIARQTYGWHKEKEWIAYPQLITKTGLHRETIAIALKALRERGYIEVFDKEDKELKGTSLSGRRKLFYRINHQASAVIPTKKKEKSELPTFKSRNFRSAIYTKETNTKELVLHTNYQKTGKDSLKKVNGYGNPDVNQILEEFEKLTGLSKAIDKDPRFWAWQFVRNKKMGLGNFSPCLKYLLRKWDSRVEISKIELIYRHFPEYERDVLDKAAAKKTIRTEIAEDGTIILLE